MIDILRRRPPEITEAEIQGWDAAYLGRGVLPSEHIYATSINVTDNPARRIHALAVTSPMRTYIDIPLIGATPDEVLAQRAYEQGTFFGEIDEERFRAFATESFNQEALVTYLNREQAGIPEKRPHDWFRERFGVGERTYGDIFIGSQGGAHNHSATIEIDTRNRNRQQFPPGEMIANFTRTVRYEMPQITISPLPVNEYLQDIQQTLRFLPKDWTPQR